MMPMEYWRNQIFVMGKIGITGFWLMSAITWYAKFAFGVFGIVKKRNMLVLAGFMVHPLMLLWLAGLSAYYGFMLDVKTLLVRGVINVAGYLIIYLLYLKVVIGIKWVVDKLFPCDDEQMRGEQDEQM